MDDILPRHSIMQGQLVNQILQLERISNNAYESTHPGEQVLNTVNSRLQDEVDQLTEEKETQCREKDEEIAKVVREKYQEILKVEEESSQEVVKITRDLNRAKTELVKEKGKTAEKVSNKHKEDFETLETERSQHQAYAAKANETTVNLYREVGELEKKLHVANTKIITQQAEIQRLEANVSNKQLNQKKSSQ